MSCERCIAAADDFAAVGRMLELYQYELSDIWDLDLDARGDSCFLAAAWEQIPDSISITALQHKDSSILDDDRLHA